MKIVYCLPDTYKPGGIERVVSLKANYLADIMGYEVYIITTGQGIREAYYDFSEKVTFFDLDINYDEMLKFSLFNRISIRSQKKKLHKQRLTNLLFRLRPDITISTFTHESDFLPDIKDGSKKILEFHFFRGHKRKYAASFKFSFLSKFAYFLKSIKEEYYTIRQFDKFVVLTEEDKNNWKSVCPTVIAIPNILPFYPSKISSTINKQVVAVGRLDAQKGFDKLIRIWIQVNKLFPDWHLKIFGSGKDLDVLQKMIDDLSLQSVVEICTPVKNIIKEYVDASLFVMTSRYEGMPMTMLEAMSCGLPVISYDFKCGPKDVIYNGKDGYIVSEDNELSFVNAMSCLMEDDQLRQVFGSNARTNIARYSEKRVMSLWVKLFEELRN